MAGPLVFLLVEGEQGRGAGPGLAWLAGVALCGLLGRCRAAWSQQTGCQTAGLLAGAAVLAWASIPPTPPARTPLALLFCFAAGGYHYSLKVAVRHHCKMTVVKTCTNNHFYQT